VARRRVRGRDKVTTQTVSERSLGRLAAIALVLISHSALAQYGGRLATERRLLELEHSQLEAERQRPDPSRAI